jgi:hypothetical protein
MKVDVAVGKLSEDVEPLKLSLSTAAVDTGSNTNTYQSIHFAMADVSQKIAEFQSSVKARLDNFTAVCV